MVMLFKNAFSIPQLDADPSSPAQEDAWVLKTTSGGVGGGEAFCGALLAIPQGPVGATTSYQFSYRTIEATTERVTLDE